MQTEQPRRWCLFTSAGDKNAIDHWLKGSSKQQWDLVVAYYGDDDRNYSRLSNKSLYAFRTKGGKFQNLKKLIVERPNFFDQYSYVWVCDDDLLMSSEQIDEAFAISQTFEFWVAQPAYDVHGKHSHKINCYAGPQADYRVVNFVEVASPIFRRDKLMEFLRLYDGSLTGYGIDYWYMNLFSANEFGRFAIIDKVQVTNPTDDQKGGREIDKLQPYEARRADWDQVRKKYGLVEYDHKVFAYCKIAAPGDRGEPMPRQKSSLLRRTLDEFKLLQSMGWRDRRSRLRLLIKKVGAKVSGRILRQVTRSNS